MKSKAIYTFFFACLFFALSAQNNANHIVKEVQSNYQNQPNLYQADLFAPQKNAGSKSAILEEEVSKASFFSIKEKNLNELKLAAPELLEFNVEYLGDTEFELKLYKKNVLTDDFHVYNASNRDVAFPYEKGQYYWGMVKGDDQSIVSVSVSSQGVSAFIYTQGETYNLGPLRDSPDQYVIYRESDLKMASPFDCQVDESSMDMTGKMDGASKMMDANNCVNMYIEVDYDIYVNKGGTQQAADYVNDAFAQVAILYANEAINFGVNEILVWDVVDPYNSGSTSTLLTTFRNELNGNYNGDLAHLVGYQGGGGIAYINVLCNDFYGVGYSAVNSTFSNVPTYSWTVEVLTHEIGHNLGSNHTHSCVWNGNSTAIDRCGPAAGYDQAPCNDSAPIPNKGTIMSYCHLVGGVGIDFNLGFGPQPGNLIRNNVYNASCLSSCAPSTANDAGISAIAAPTGTVCSASVSPEVSLSNYGTNTLTSVSIQYSVDGGTSQNYSWTGSLATGNTTTVTLPSISFTLGSHTFNASTSNPNGNADEDNSNNASSSSFTRQATQTYYQDADGDGFGNPNVTTTDCSAPNGYVSNNSDCDDTNGNAYPGASCNDNDVCTTGDVLDANCNCSGSYADADGDGVCDGEDVCPGGDDNQDADGDGIPDFCDCNAAQTSFNVNPLSHNGGGSSNTSVSFASGDKDASFTVSNLGAKLNGNPNSRYEDVVNISYVNGSGNTVNYGTFSGANQSTVNVTINSQITSLTVSLSNGQNSNQNVSVNLSTIDYCTGTPPCPDADGDGVCDANDQCPGFNDNLIGTTCNDGDACTTGDVWGSDCNCAGTYADSDGDGVCDGEDICPGGDDTIDSDGDGIPDDCDGNCEITLSALNPNPLSHQGSGSSSSSVNFPLGNIDVSFTISGLNARTNGNPNNRYIEQVTVTYVDGNGSPQSYGTFGGDTQSSVNVSISGGVQSVSVSLQDGYDGNAGNQNLSVNFSTVSSCAPAAPLEGQGSSTIVAYVYPNPANEAIWINVPNDPETAQIRLLDMLGRELSTYQMEGQSKLYIPLSNSTIQNQMIFVSIEVPGKETLIRKIIINRE